MLKNSENSAKVTELLGFNFDVVIVLIDLPNKNIKENSKLRVDVSFNKNKIQITSSRINVSEFKPERSFEFQERPSVLKQKLFKNPLECQVYYDNQLIGTCTFLWPQDFINCIEDGCGRELTRCDEADIKHDNEKVGRMEIISRLQIKCHEYEEKQPLTQTKNFCSPDENLLNPNDVMFVVCQTNGSISCSDVGIIPGSSSGSSEHGTFLDLSDFRHLHGKTLSNTDVLQSINAKCCKRKESANLYKDMVKDLLDKANELPSCTKNNFKRQLSQPACNDQIKSIDCTSETRFSSCSSSDSCQPYYCISDENASEGKSMTIVREKPTKRYCSLCHDDITWLPRFAACPKCGFRPIAYNVEEKSYDHTLTANKILKEYINYPAENKKSEICEQKLRCTCKDSKICAHCRIKQLCKDIFQAPRNGEGDCGKCETKSSDLYNICRTNSRGCRPYLAKCFQDLRELFEINTAKKNAKNNRKVLNKVSKNSLSSNNADLQNHQQKSEEVKCSLRSRSREKNKNEQREKFMEKTVQKQESCKNKIFEYNEQRKYSGMKIGHERCFAGKKIVPRNMGWLWNAEEDRVRAGWMPGAIRKPIKILMQHFLYKKKLNSCGEFSNYENCRKHHKGERDYTKEPTLHICKKNGAYYITLRPLKAVGVLKECAERDVNMKPIEFKITKNPVLLERRKLKQCLKDQGFAKCTCHQPISECCCRSFLERKKLEYQCCKECHKRELPNCSESLILSDTTDSEAEFDFGVTPPAAVEQSHSGLKGRKKVSSSTQYEKDDWEIKEEYPKPAVKYFKLHNCAVGNRFGKTFGPYGTKGYYPGAIPSEGVYGPYGLIPHNLRGRYIKRGTRTAVRGAEAFRGPDGKFSMAQYLAFKDSAKLSPNEIYEKKKRTLKLLQGANPPLLCEVDKRGKPVDFCRHNCFPCCLSDDRIC